MPDRTLQDCHILVVEDEYMLAEELSMELADAGAKVLGPVPSVRDALELLASSEPDGAVLDVNLGGEDVFPVADALIARGLPFIFTTGYDPAVLPIRFSRFSVCEKPFSMSRVTAAIGRAVHA